MPGWHDRHVSMIAARCPNYARRQQYRRLTRAGEAGLAAILVAVLGAWAVSARLELPAIGLLVAAPALGMNARRWLALARRAVMRPVHVRSVERVEDDVLAVSIDRLTRVLRIAAAMASARTR
jgi:hypothetical protein